MPSEFEKAISLYDTFLMGNISKKRLKKDMNSIFGRELDSFYLTSPFAPIFNACAHPSEMLNLKEAHKKNGGSTFYVLEMNPFYRVKSSDTMYSTKTLQIVDRLIDKFSLSMFRQDITGVFDIVHEEEFQDAEPRLVGSVEEMLDIPEHDRSLHRAILDSAGFSVFLEPTDLYFNVDKSASGVELNRANLIFTTLYPEMQRIMDQKQRSKNLSTE